jgi:type I restriction enzyme S subunit
MSSEWQTGKLGDFIELKRGYDLPQANRQPGTVPLVSSSGISDFQAESKVNGPGVVTGRYGTIGQVFFIDRDFWPLNTTLYVRNFKGNDAKFIHYFLKTLDFLAYSDKAAVPGVNRNHLHEASVTLPDLATQKEIATILGSLDDRITLLRKTNTTLEAIAQALFKSWFVDFDPVRAKQEGREPEGMDADNAALFPDSFEESELGLVPKGWRAGTLNDLAVYQNGYAFKTKDWQETGYPVVKIGNVKPGVIDISGCSWVSDDVISGLDRFLLKRGDLLVGMTGYVGETGLVPDLSPPAYLNQRVGRISTKAGIADLGFVYCVVRNPQYKFYAEERSHGSAQANVSGSDLMAYPAIIPTSEVLCAFNQTLHSLINKILTNHSQAQTLATLRDTLLPRLISGQLRLPDAEALIEEATA